jgi:hypothetical protein
MKTDTISFKQDVPVPKSEVVENKDDDDGEKKFEIPSIFSSENSINILGTDVDLENFIGNILLCAVLILIVYKFVPVNKENVTPIVATATAFIVFIVYNIFVTPPYTLNFDSVFEERTYMAERECIMFSVLTLMIIFAPDSKYRNLLWSAAFISAASMLLLVSVGDIPHIVFALRANALLYNTSVWILIFFLVLNM